MRATHAINSIYKQVYETPLQGNSPKTLSSRVVFTKGTPITFFKLHYVHIGLSQYLNSDEQKCAQEE